MAISGQTLDIYNNEGIKTNMDFEKNQLRKALVSLAVERVLIDIGDPVYEKVIKQLSKDYYCYLPDFY